MPRSVSLYQRDPGQDRPDLPVRRPDKAKEILHCRSAADSQSVSSVSKILQEFPDYAQFFPGDRLIHIHPCAIDGVTAQHIFHGSKADPEFFAGMIPVGRRIHGKIYSEPFHAGVSHPDIIFKCT